MDNVPESPKFDRINSILAKTGSILAEIRNSKAQKRKAEEQGCCKDYRAVASLRKVKLFADKGGVAIDFQTLKKVPLKSVKCNQPLMKSW